MNLNYKKGLVLTAAFYLGSHFHVMAQEKKDSATKEKKIDEIVLVNVGYGVQKKSVVTGAISKVTAKEFENAPSGGVGQLLQGRAAGLTIAMNSGAPGSNSTVRVRGVTTYSGANDPLWVVDGVVVPNGDIMSLNQSDIESIEVLKDAASAAIYGVQAAKGVILITTKSGRKGRVSVSLNGYTSYSAPSRVLKLLNATEYGALMNEKVVAGGGLPLFSDLSTLGVGTDWQKQVFNNSAFGTNYDLSISGKTEKSTFYTSFGLLDQQGIVATDISNYKKLSARINSTHKFINDIFTLGENVFYTHTKNQGIGNTNNEFGGVLADAIMMDPLTPVVETDPVKALAYPYTVSPYIVRDKYGNPYGISGMQQTEIVNPMAYIQTRLGNYSWSDVLVGNVYLQAEILKGLKFKTSLGGKKAFWGDYAFTPKYYLSTQTLNTVQNNLMRSNGQGFDWNIENTLTFDKQFGEHNLGILLGQGAYVTGEGNYSSATHYDLPTNSWTEASFNIAIPEANKKGYSYDFNPVHRTSLFARLNYNYKEKYIFTGIIRRDGSSLFGPNKKYGNFPSLSAGWVISKENFWPVNKVVNDLKFRFGYGSTGNDGSLVPGQYVSLMSTSGYNYFIGNQIWIGTAPATLSNPDLHWEVTTQSNFGLETRLFKNFTLSAEYYEKKTKDILLQVSIPGYVGVTNQPWSNVGDMTNKGFEMELGYRKTWQDFSFSANGNFATLKNEVTNLNGINYIAQGSYQSMVPTYPAILKTGYSYGSFFGYQTAGIFQNWDQVNSYKNSSGSLIQPNAKPGDFRWTDVNGDGKIDSNDRTYLGNSLPKITYGLNLNFTYKNFDFNAMFQGVAGNKIFQGLGRLDVSRANYQTVALTRWHGEGTSDTYPRLTTDDTNGNFTNMSNFYLQNGDYLRLKVVSLGYTLPKSVLESIHAEKIRIYITANNLVTFTKYTGYDPEIGGNVMGIDKGYYPQPRTFLFGLNLNF